MINLTAQGSGYYIVSVNGVDTTSHVTEREAIEAAVNQEQANPNSVVSYRHDYMVRVDQVADPVPAPGPIPSPPNQVPILFSLTSTNAQDLFANTRGVSGVGLWDGSFTGNVVNLTRWSGGNGEFQSGWAFNPTSLLPVSFSSMANDTFWLRFRWETLQPLGEGGHEANMKWFIFGGPGVTGTRRMIFNIRNGLLHDPNSGALIGGSLSDYTKFLMSDGVGSNRLQLLVPNNQVLNCQIGWRYGSSPRMMMYINNNNINSPTASLDVPGWEFPEGWDTGFWGNTDSTNSSSTTDAVFRVSDMQMGLVFDPNWHS